MKKVFNIITYLAVMALLLAMSSIESALDKGSLTPFLVILISGSWIVGYAWDQEEERLRAAKQSRLRGRR